MKKPNKRGEEIALADQKPRAVNIRHFGSGLLDGTPRSSFTMSSAAKIIIAGPISRSSRHTAVGQAVKTD